MFIFSDAPRSMSDQEEVAKVRKVIRSDEWCSDVHIIERETNLGCEKSILDGVNYLCEEFGKVIVLEDDLITSKYFLEYMNYALNHYEDEQSVFQISGYNYPININSNSNTFLYS